MRWRPASEAWLLWVGWLSVVLGGGGKGGVSVDVTSKCRWPFSSPAFFSFVRLGGWWALGRQYLCPHTHAPCVLDRWRPGNFRFVPSSLGCGGVGSVSQPICLRPSFFSEISASQQQLRKGSSERTTKPTTEDPVQEGALFF